MARIAVGVLLCGCGPSVGEAVDCDAEKVRLFEHGADEMAATLPLRIGDRVYTTVGKRTDVKLGSVWDEFSDVRVVSAGTCGQSRRTIGRGTFGVQLDDRWPGALISREADDALVALDPEGGQPVRVTAPHGSDQFPQPTDRGDVYIDERSRLLLQRPAEHVGDPIPEPEVIYGSALPLVGFGFFGDTIAFIDGDHEAVVLDLDSGAAEVVAPDAERVWLSEDAAWIAYTRDETPEVEDDPVRVFLVERSSGTEVLVGDAEADLYYVRWFADSFVVDVADAAGVQSRRVALGSLEMIDIPLGVNFYDRYDATRYIAQLDGGWGLYDVATGMPQLVVEGEGLPMVDDEGIEVVDIPLNSKPSDIGPWRRGTYATGQQTIRAKRASSARASLSDDAVVTLLDVDAEGLGELVLVDAALDEHAVDDHVARLLAGSEFNGFDDGTLVYDVRDGDRSGVWVTTPEL